MKILNGSCRGLKIIKGINHYDSRGYFREIFRNSFFNKKKFIFWCVSKSKKNVLRGLHLQRKIPQDIIVSVLKGEIFDVVVDLRKKSKSYGKFSYITLSDKNSTSIFIPAGFAHGYCCLKKENIVLYGLTNYRSAKNETGILWNDNTLKIRWPIKKPIISKKDKKNITFKKFNYKY